MANLKQFNVSVQSKFYKVVEAVHTGAALSLISKDIASGLVPDFDPNKPHDIVIKNVVENHS